MTLKWTSGENNSSSKKISSKSGNVGAAIQREENKQYLSSSKNPSNKSLDIISELPDDILVSILSLLTFREATATTILSTRWRRLHTMLNVVLLKCPLLLQQMEDDLYKRGDETQLSDYINRINHALDSYTGNKVIKRFRVDIPHTDKEVNNIETTNKLLEFALSRETEIIDIHFLYCTSVFVLGGGTYCFSTWIIKNVSGSSSLPGLKCLKELSLTGVSLSNSAIGILLSNLVVLERLSIVSSRISGNDFFGPNLWIDGPPTSKLKHLIISNVSQQGTDISDLRNLVSLRCDELPSFFPIRLYDLPKLVHLRVRSATDCILEQNFPDIECINCVRLQRLEIFTGLYSYEIKEGGKMISMKNEHILTRDLDMLKIQTELIFTRHRLKHLEMNVVVDKECDLHQLFSLIERFPCLKKLEIKLIWSLKPKYKPRRLDEERVNRVTTIDYLNTIKLSEFCGSVAELEFVLCVINNGGVLDELILEGCATNCVIQQREIAHSYKYLISVAPSFVDLILK